MKRTIHTKLHRGYIAIVALLSIVVNAQQDPQYTQYMYNTINVNPAYAGSREVLSIFGMYRTQWIGLEGAPDTGVFSAHSPVGKQVGLGVTFMNDRIGISEESTISADFSYTIPMSADKRYQLALGLKGTAHLLNVDFTKLNIWDPNDPYLNNISNRFSPNVGAGAYLYSDEFYVGLSVPNILETKHYNDNDRESLASERTHGYLISGYVFDMSAVVKIKPTVMLKAVTGAPLQVDLSANALFYEQFTLGVAWRWQAAVSAMVGFQVTDGWFIGYSYDAETTQLANYNSGSHEIFLRYEFIKRIDRIIPPRFF
jgi:type IX secretion system PorP/SprF family membrane protein